MIRPLKFIKSALWGLLVLCVALRVMAWLVGPALPVIVMLFVVSTIFVFIFTLLLRP